MVFRNKNVKQRSIIKNKVLQEGRMIMKKKIIIAAGILVVIAVGAGVYLNHPSGGGVDQEILARLAGQYGIPYDDDMDEDAYYDNECFWEMVIFTEPDEFFTTKLPVLMIYDAEAGDPGLAGTIVELDTDTIKIKIDNDMTDKEYYPSGWEMESNTMEFTYEETEDGLELTNHGKTFTFVKYQED